VSVKVRKDRIAQVVKQVRSLARREVLVGIPSAAAGRKEGAITNASLGYIHENGSPANNIPARPFLVPGAASISAQASARFEATARAALSGKDDAVEKGLNEVGLIGQNAVRARINSGEFAPLSEQTLAARRRRGRSGTKPLIDSGQLRNSITYSIRPKGR